uniref:Uncharacterized protein n=1 Tax=viral metagenome TaxID=1070528 RepID=A0A6M3X5S6_9ZZZZ
MTKLARIELNKFFFKQRLREAIKDKEPLVESLCPKCAWQRGSSNKETGKNEMPPRCQEKEQPVTECKEFMPIEGLMR